MGDVVIVPGECARAERGGGVIALKVVDGRGGGDERRVRAPAGSQTHVRYAAGRVEVDRRVGCDRKLHVGP